MTVQPILSEEVLSIGITPQNDPPIVDQGIANHLVNEDTLWTFVVPANAFDDVDGDTLTLSATLDDDGVLPSWLSFTPGTRTFAGTPPQNFNGVIGLEVTADDGNETVSTIFDLAVDPVNDPPVITSNGGGGSATIRIAENSNGVTRVRATDADGTAPVFSIAGGSDGGAFTIGGSTGVLRFKSAPDYERPADSNGDNIYSVVVRSSDGSATDQQTLSVVVGNIAGQTLVGTKKKDTLTGTSEENILNGGEQKDILTGGAGPDAFVFNARPKDKWADTITDFEAGVDTIHLDNKAFKKIGGDGALNTKAFNVGNSVDSKKERILYDDKKGWLYHDRDGSKSKYNAVKIAKLDKGLDLSADDFLVI